MDDGKRTPTTMGERTAYSGTQPLSLAKAIHGATGACFKGANKTLGHLCFHWDKIAGPEKAAVTCPTRLVLPTPQAPRGLVTVAFWGGDGLLLSYDAPHLCARVNQYMGFGAVHEIKWRQVPPPSAGPTSLPKNAPLNSLPDLSDHDTHAIRTKVADLPAEIATALEQLGQTLARLSTLSRHPSVNRQDLA